MQPPVIMPQPTMLLADAGGMVSQIWQRFFLGLWQRTQRQDLALAWPAPGETLTKPHGLYTLPWAVGLWVECLVPELGWASGDVLPLRGGVLGWANATDVCVLGESGGVELPDKTTGVPGSITPVNWQLIVRAQA